MDLNPILPKLLKCPTCGSKLLDIVYGLSDAVERKGVIDGGCTVTPDMPTKGCEKCGWQGAPDGRTWETEFTVTWEELDENHADVTKISTHQYDLKAMTELELVEFGATNLEARFELVHRGIEPSDIDKAFADAVSMPLIRLDEFLFFWNNETGVIEQVSYFWAHWREHEFMFIRPGMDAWEGSYSLDEFHEKVFQFRQPNIEVWSSGFPEEFTDDDFMSDPANFGSAFIKALLANQTVSKQDLERSAERLLPAKYWPDWFEPAFSF